MLGDWFRLFGYLQLWGLGTGHPHILSSCSLGIDSTQWPCSKGEHPKTESQVGLCFLLNLPSQVDYAVSFPQHSIHRGSDKGSLSLKGRIMHFFPLHGKVMEEHLESKTLMQPAICIKYNFPQSAIWPHNTHSFHLLTFPSKSIKFHLVMVGELCQACSKPKTQAPFFRELEWECDRGQKTSWGQGTYMKGQLGCLGHMFHGCLRVWGN